MHRFKTKKWIEVHDQSDGTYNTNKEIRFKVSIIRIDLCDYSNASILAKRTITFAGPNDNAYDNKLALKNNAAFISCMSNINDRLIDNAEDVDVIAPMYNLIKYIKN